MLNNACQPGVELVFLSSALASLSPFSSFWKKTLFIVIKYGRFSKKYRYLKSCSNVPWALKEMAGFGVFFLIQLFLFFPKIFLKISRTSRRKPRELTRIK